MSVDITWSASQGGSAITQPLSWGNISNGSSSEDDLYIRHNGVEKITNCAFYIQSYSGTYSGSFDAATDYAELLSWGASDEGFLINQNLLGSFPGGSYTAHKTGQGTATVPITLDSDSIIGGASLSDGEMEGSGVGSEEAHIKVKIAVPAAEGDAGIRQFDQCLRYTYTS